MILIIILIYFITPLSDNAAAWSMVFFVLNQSLVEVFQHDVHQKTPMKCIIGKLWFTATQVLFFILKKN